MEISVFIDNYQMMHIDMKGGNGRDRENIVKLISSEGNKTGGY